MVHPQDPLPSALPPEIFTIGHSNHPIDRFLALLSGAGVTAVADVRSVPYSRFAPQFRKPALTQALAAAGIGYVFLGEALGGRPRDPGCWRDGRADYELMAATPRFRDGLDRVLEEARRDRVALMCAEREPLDCHRALLVARRLKERGALVRHILFDGRIEDHADTERRLLALTGQDTGDLLTPAADALARAYALRGGAIAVTATEVEGRPR